MTPEYISVIESCICRIYISRIPEKWTPKNGPREKWSSGKMVLGEKWSSEKWSPKKWSPENWSPEKWSREKWSPGNSETKNRAVRVKHRGVYVECLDVINL